MRRLRIWLPALLAAAFAPLLATLAVKKLPSLMQGLVQVFSDSVGFVQNYLALDAGTKLLWYTQFNAATNTAAGLSANANESLNAVSLPAIAANTTGTVTITNGSILATSVILTFVFNQAADATAARRVSTWVESTANGSAVIGYHTDVLMSAAWTCWYIVIN